MYFPDIYPLFLYIAISHNCSLYSVKDKASICISTQQKQKNDT